MIHFEKQNILEPEGVLDIFKSARIKLKQMMEKRDTQNRQLGQWLSKIHTISGRPVFSRELLTFVAIVENMDNNETIESNKHLFKEDSLLEKAKIHIAENMKIWIESSLKRLND